METRDNVCNETNSENDDLILERSKISVLPEERLQSLFYALIFENVCIFWENISWFAFYSFF